MALNFDYIANFFQGSSLGKLSANFQKIVDEFGKTIYRDGSSYMQADLDMNSNRIINHARPVEDGDLATLADVKEIAAELSAGPPGPSNNTRLSLSDLKEADVNDKTSLYDGSLWTWTLGDYSGIPAEELNVFYVKADGIPLTTGVWVRQKSAGAALKQPFANTITISAEKKLNDTISLSSFRYAADPIDDWSPTFQRAIDSVSAAGGGTIIIPFGTYPLKVRLGTDGGVVAFEMKSNVYLQGASKTGTILRLANNQIGQGTYMRIISSYGTVNNVGLSNFTIDGNRDGQNIWREQGNGGNIVIGTCNDCTITDLISINGNGQGIQVRASGTEVSQRVSIRGCTVKGMSGSTLNADGTINQLYNGNGIGIQVSRAGSVNITNNMITGCRDNGIDTYSDDGPGNPPIGGAHVISSNNISLCRTGIFPETAAACLVIGNYIVDCVEGGIFANRIYGAPQTVRICNNMVGNMPVGIRVTGDCSPASGVAIYDNTVYSITDPAGACVQLGLPGANVSYIDVSRNTFATNSPTIPFIAIYGTQAAFIRGTDNHYFGAPTAGYTVYNAATTSVEVIIEGFIGVSDSSVPDLSRKWAKIRQLEVSNLAGFFGATPVGRRTLSPEATDEASAITLVNSIRTALIQLGLGGN